MLNLYQIFQHFPKLPPKKIQKLNKFSRILCQNLNNFGKPMCFKFSLSFPLPKLQFKERCCEVDLQGPISSDYLVHCSHPFFMSIRIAFSASYSLLSQSLVTLTSLARLLIEFCQCPLRRSCQSDCMLLLHQLVIGPVTVHLT